MTKLLNRMSEGDKLQSATTYRIAADTPEETIREIVKWLEDQALAHSVAARLAERKGTIKEETIKSKTYNFAAQFVGKMLVQPRGFPVRLGEVNKAIGNGDVKFRLSKKGLSSY